MGKWHALLDDYAYQCARCGRVAPMPYDYCPHCGDSMNAKPKKPGSWILRDISCPESYECSGCGERFEMDKMGMEPWRFCPKCGQRNGI